MRKICKIVKENGITQEDNTCFGLTKNRVYGDHILNPGIPWNHHNLYPASHISSWTPEITCNFGINWNQNPAPKVFFWQKSNFNQVLISGNFTKIKIDNNKLYPVIHFLSIPLPYFFVGVAECKLFPYISEYVITILKL